MFDAPRRAAGLFSGRALVAGGWAVDLFLDRETRAHADVDLAIFRCDQAMLPRSGWTWTTVGGAVWAGERLELPVHQLHGAGPAGERVEVLLQESDRGEWRFRRDLAVSMPLAQSTVLSAQGIAILAPEIVLLFKAKAPRAKDEADFAALAPSLPAARRAWLSAAIGRCHPGHLWLRALE